jgi:hypothetical protein
MLYDYAGRAIEVVAVVDPNEAILAQIAEAKAKIEELKKEEVKVAKNHRPGKVTDSVWIRLGAFEEWGKVPQQQKDLATILTNMMQVGVQYSEAAVFAEVTERAKDFPSLSTSDQDATYLLRYYRGLNKKDDPRYAGFIKRNFLQVI